MLRQISVQVKADNKLQTAAKGQGVRLSITDCKPFDRTGMSLLLELKGEAQALRAATMAIRRVEGVRQLIEGTGADGKVPMLAVMDRPAICRASNEAAIICLECPLSSDVQPASWKFIAHKSSDLRQILTGLAHEGVETRIEDVAPLEKRTVLTARQREILTTAVARGYFEFPRKISLTQLSELVGVKPSSLSEVLRSAERTIMANALAP